MQPYCKHVEGGPSHGHGQYAQKIWVKIACMVPEISTWTDSNLYSMYVLMQFHTLLPFSGFSCFSASAT